MQTEPNNPVVVTGFLLSDGTVRLDHPLGIQSGPIEVTIRPIAAPRDRLPDPPADDLSESARFDLPRRGDVRSVHPSRVLHRFPDPV